MCVCKWMSDGVCLTGYWSIL